jgi:hypothetical protein
MEITGGFLAFLDRRFGTEFVVGGVQVLRISMYIVLSSKMRCCVLVPSVLLTFPYWYSTPSLGSSSHPSHRYCYPNNSLCSFNRHTKS